MDKQLMNEWKQRNKRLQDYYNHYLLADNQEERRTALVNIQQELSWGPFLFICSEKKIPLIQISNRGLDDKTIECINDIDIIANGI
jgi:hypothetical protein